MVVSKDPLDHPKRMLDFRPHFRLGAVASPLRFTQWPMTLRVCLDKTLGLGRMLPNHRVLPVVGGIAPHSCLLPIAVISVILGYRAHSPPWPLPNESMSSGYPRRYWPSYRSTTGCPSWSDASQDPAPWSDSSSTEAHGRWSHPRWCLGSPAAPVSSDIPRSVQRAAGPTGGVPSDAETCRWSSHRVRARGPDQSPPTAAWRASRTASLPRPDPTG